MSSHHIYVAIPAMDELQDLPLTLQDLASQECEEEITVYVCVNQPDDYWQLPDKQSICFNNQQLLHVLRAFRGLSLHILDYASPGKGWKGKDFGVGWARKVMFDQILQEATPDDLIVSLDADTRLQPHYLQSLADNFRRHPAWPALAVPYYHPLSGDEVRDRAILRYEFYMRNYAINLLRIDSPYAFTAIGSAIVMRAGALRKIGGITPLKSGEDFYLVQKLRKMAPIGLYNAEPVYPAARYSDRVAFGTGPAMSKGSQGDWQSYPIFHHSLFDPIAEAYGLIPELFTRDVSNPFLDFLQESAKSIESLWQPIRQNIKDLPHFTQAFHEKADGLRILQYLRRQPKRRDEDCLFENLQAWIPDQMPEWWHPEMDFGDFDVEKLDFIRNLLFKYEIELKKIEDYK